MKLCTNCGLNRRSLRAKSRDDLYRISAVYLQAFTGNICLAQHFDKLSRLHQGKKRMAASVCGLAVLPAWPGALGATDIQVGDHEGNGTGRSGQGRQDLAVSARRWLRLCRTERSHRVFKRPAMSFDVRGGCQEANRRSIHSGVKVASPSTTSSAPASRS